MTVLDERGPVISAEHDIPVATTHQKAERSRGKPKRWEIRYALAAGCLDFAAATMASVAGLLFWADDGAATVTRVLAAALPVLWVAVIALAGGYQHRFLAVGSEEYNRVAVGALGLTVLVGSVSWATQLDIARGYVGVALPIAAVLTLVGRRVVRASAQSLRSRGRLRHRTVVLGDAGSAAELVAHLARSAKHGYEVVGVCLRGQAAGEQPCFDVPVLGGPMELADAVDQLRADTVAVASSSTLGAEELRRLAWQLEPVGANLVVAPALMDVTGPRISVRPVEGLPLLHVEQPRFTGIKRLVKQTYDPVVAAVGLAVISPVLLLIAIAIKFDSRGPVFFRQTRVGRLGKPFTIVKFRTMVADAEARKAELAHLNEGSGPLFKMKRDPRITRVGAFLRKTSLDELPQLVNVVTGSMSLVGPRPHLQEEIEMFGDDFRRRLLVKPGLTGLWQVSGRSDLSFEESVRVDLRYVENWTLAMDAAILWRTLSVVMRGSGAY